MPDDDQHDHEHHHARGFAVPLPSGMIEAIAASHDRHHMSAHDAANRNAAFLDSLNVEQLVALRGILCADNESASNNFFDGQVYSILRVVHRVDPYSGRDPLEEFVDAVGPVRPEEPSAE